MSAETVDEWLNRGVLRASDGTVGEFTRVDPTSFVEAEAKLSRLRAQGLSQRLVLRVMKGPSAANTIGARVDPDPGDAWFTQLARGKVSEEKHSP